jgi:hypothetical protein
MAAASYILSAGISTRCRMPSESTNETTHFAMALESSNSAEIHQCNTVPHVDGFLTGRTLASTGGHCGDGILRFPVAAGKRKGATIFADYRANSVWSLSSPQQPRDGEIHPPSKWSRLYTSTATLRSGFYPSLSSDRLPAEHPRITKSRHRPDQHGPSSPAVSPSYRRVGEAKPPRRASACSSGTGDQGYVAPEARIPCQRVRR